MGEGCRSFAAGCAGAGLSRIRSCGRRAARNKQRQGDENAVTRSIERKKENRFVEGGEEENEEEEGVGERTMDEFDSGPRSNEKDEGSTAPLPEKVQIGNSFSELREIYEREGISSRISRSNINDRSGSNALEVAPKFEHRSSEGCNNGQHTNGRFIALLVVFMVFLESITKDAKATIMSRLWMCWVLVCGMFGIIILMRTQYAQQSYKVSDAFPFKWINKKWKEGFYVTAMAAAGVRWAVVMSRNAGFSDQAVELDCLYPSEGIHRRWDSSYRITATRNLAAFVLSVLNRKPADETQEMLRTSAFPCQHVRKSGQRISTPHLFVTAERFLEAPFSSYDGREEAAKSRLTTTLSSCPSIYRLKAPVKCGS